MKRTVTILVLMLALILPIHTPFPGASYVAALSSADATTTDTAVQSEVPFSQLRPTVKISTYKDKTRIRWAKVPHASYYMVYRASSAKGSYKKIKKTTSLSYNDGTGSSGKVYYYKVRAFQGKNKHSKYSKPVKFKTIYRVYIACGHGTSATGIWDSGCTYKGMQEAKLMLPITKDFVRYMRQSGVYVYTDADIDNKLNIIKGIKAANKKKISAYISVHCDWKYAPSGTMPLYKTKKDRQLASALNKGVRSTLSIGTRGLKHRPELRELYKTKAVSCIFETGSISKDYEKFKKKHDKYGKGLALGLSNYLGIPLVD